MLTHTHVSSPAGHGTGGAVLVFIAMTGANVSLRSLFVCAVAETKLFAPITHVGVND